jgi:hypothetical protein
MGERKRGRSNSQRQGKKRQLVAACQIRFYCYGIFRPAYFHCIGDQLFTWKKRSIIFSNTEQTMTTGSCLPDQILLLWHLWTTFHLQCYISKPLRIR